MRYRDGMNDDEMKKFLASVEEMDAAYSRAAAEADASIRQENDEAAEEAAWYDELNREFNHRRKGE
jgi:hypothetical protein